MGGRYDGHLVGDSPRPSVRQLWRSLPEIVRHALRMAPARPRFDANQRMPEDVIGDLVFAEASDHTDRPAQAAAARAGVDGVDERVDVDAVAHVVNSCPRCPRMMAAKSAGDTRCLGAEVIARAATAWTLSSPRPVVVCSVRMT